MILRHLDLYMTKEEIDYGINDQKLPIIVIYPEYDTVESLLVNGNLKPEIKNLWNKLPVFRDSMRNVPTIHVALSKDQIKSTLQDRDFITGTQADPGIYHYNS